MTLLYVVLSDASPVYKCMNIQNYLNCPLSDDPEQFVYRLSALIAGAGGVLTIAIISTIWSYWLGWVSPEFSRVLLTAVLALGTVWYATVVSYSIVLQKLSEIT